MKRILGMILVMGMLASVAMAATNVTSVNAVGYNSVTIGPGQYSLCVLPFETFDDSTAENLIGDQLPQDSSILIWDRVGDSYISGSRTRSGWDITNIIIRGDGFWLRNAGATTNTVTFLGEVPEDYNDAGTTTVYNVDGLDAVGYAYPTDVVWTNTELAKNANTDSVLVWNGSGYDSYSKTRSGWDSPAGYTIEAGKGFWVGTSASIDWAEVVPYDLD